MKILFHLFLFLVFIAVIATGIGFLRSSSRGEFFASTITVSNMKSLDDAEQITQTLSDIDGIVQGSISCDTDTGIVSFLFASHSMNKKISLKKIEHIIVNTGYSIERPSTSVKLSISEFQKALREISHVQ